MSSRLWIAYGEDRNKHSAEDFRAHLTRQLQHASVRAMGSNFNKAIWLYHDMEISISDIATVLGESRRKIRKWCESPCE